MAFNVFNQLSPALTSTISKSSLLSNLPLASRSEASDVAITKQTEDSTELEVTGKRPDKAEPAPEPTAEKLESVPAKLVPFDMEGLSGPLAPIAKTGGLVFQYTPSISESVSINYDKSDVVHSNEQYHVYRSTENRKISLSNVKFTADTEENARYMLAAIQFFRVYSLMDFGVAGSGKAPSPMWFYAYGAGAYNKVPVIMTGYDLSMSHEVDQVRVKMPSGNYVWLPVVMEINGINLIVQHTPGYWKNQFKLKDFYSGGMFEVKEMAAPSRKVTTSPTLSTSTSSLVTPDTGPSLDSTQQLIDLVKPYTGGKTSSDVDPAGAIGFLPVGGGAIF